MKSSKTFRTDIIVIGSGMGGMSAACMLAKDGYKVTVLEAAHVPGGCSSSYKRKGYVFESGATTLIGFDENQPLRTLEEELGIRLKKQEINPSMTVHLGGQHIIRYKNRQAWLEESVRAFPEIPRSNQKAFWDEAFHVADTVWKVSKRNVFFPPKRAADWLQLAINNNPTDAPVLRYAFQSMASVMQKFEVDTPVFRRFIDEQLMITAQAKAHETPFIFGAAGITYTSYANYYVPGGLLNMVRQLEKHLVQSGGELKTRRKVIRLSEHERGGYVAETDNGERYFAGKIVSNIPIWNMKEISTGELGLYYEKESERYDEAWGAFTMGVVTGDAYDQHLTLHHQLHLPAGEQMPETEAGSVFVSMSARGDTSRAPEGERALNISCHTPTRKWFEMGESYEATKTRVQDFILDFLSRNFPGFKESGVKMAFPATPVTWQNWVYRKDGRVGGIPQSMSRSLVDWPQTEAPFPGIYQCGDTSYPGQGIPGVTLGGINVYYRIKKNDS
ncbi:MAG: NAD(P)/FAD-dependent oxidoreductase [Candidatus Cyclonatronum sp.]|uniref:phytoene desaturase family protein n=1 Tax=Cyclonatronum sp. TaxID=3024185 RepID=UPI0025B85FE6|nr:NAD(P)/FAD-dependent oxidoreductase [Cyclonatronum sp.]MCH8485600.1 NAD(P)/FAD-dependent oxidoreductase [Cyclonatronum sp.]